MPTLAELTKQIKKLKDDDRWQAESDASAIQRAAETKSDVARLKRAKLVADHAAMAAAEKAKLIK